MGDRTSNSITFFGCPPEKVESVLGILDQHGYHDVDWGSVEVPRDRLLLADESYTQHEGALDLPEQVAADLIQAAPEAVFEAQADPKYEYLGMLVKYHPDLGSEQFDCDSNGRVVLTEDEVVHVLTKAEAEHWSREDLSGRLLKMVGAPFGALLPDASEQATEVLIPKEDG